MGLISQSIKNLKSGISQQPNILRFPEQAESQINGWSSETRGLTKRPPTVFGKVLGEASEFGDAPMIHAIDRDESERYHIVFTGTGIRAFDMNGNEKTVNGDMGYVTCDSPRDCLRMVTIADYTFITNKTKVVAIGTDTNLPDFNTENDFLIVVRGGQYGRTVTVKVDGLTASLALPSGISSDTATAAAMVAKTDAQVMITNLITAMGDAGFWAHYDYEAGNGYIHMTKKSGGTYTGLSVTDGYANQLAVAVTHSVQTFTKLPIEAPNGYVVEVVGDSQSQTDAFYVQYDSTDKVWKECVGWDTVLNIDETTMPHTLVRESDGSFTFGAAEWGIRTCGDEDTNEDPSFIGGTINDIFFFRNRLGFLSGENIIMSRTANYFRFFPASVANASDDDPIDSAVSHNRISILKYAVPFNEQLILFSDKGQFILGAQGVLTAQSAELNLTTEFEVSDLSRPLGLGRGVYYCTPRAEYSTLSRFYAVQDVTDVKNSEDITSHVPNYIPNGIFSITGSTTENFVAVLTSGAKNKVFLYKFLYLNEQQVQRSWSEWNAAEDVEVLAFTPVGSKVYGISRNGSHIYTFSVNFTVDSLDFVGEPYQLYLDLKTPYTIPSEAFNDDTYKTTVDLSTVYGMHFVKGNIVMITEGGVSMEFECPDTGWPDGTPVIEIEGDFSGQNVFFGKALNFYYEFSKFLIKTNDASGMIQTQDIGRLQLRRAWFNFENSGAFYVDITNKDHTFTYTMSGKKVGDSTMMLDQVGLVTGQFKFPCAGEANSITVGVRSTSTTPLTIIGAGWQGNFINRAKGI